MTRIPMLVLLGVLVAACSDPSGPSGGSLLVSTTMTGSAPDDDGYQLLVDGEPALTLDGNDSEVLELDGGEHTLDVRGLDPHCTVEPALPLEVLVDGGERVPLDFEVACAPTGVIVTPRYSGIDVPTFYRVAVDGVPGNSVLTSAPTTMARLGPGEHTIELLVGAGNCTPDGPSSRTVTVISGAFVPLDFEVRCTATTGVIEVLVEAAGEDVGPDFEVRVGGTSRPFTFPSPFHLTGIPGGEHTVELDVPVNCAVDSDPRTVSVSVGGPVRDTVRVVFAVTCVRLSATIRLVTKTSGTLPDRDGYDVYLWEGDWYYEYPSLLGQVDLSGELEVEVRPGTYRITVEVPRGCTFPVVGAFTLTHGVVFEVPFEVVCGS
ncbi:MAG TPA: hypothetical protein VEB59_01135 [Gemmatimonadales bacterium]|nr:hypothetical protein [Gemmatimonadales bacterium]